MDTIAAATPVGTLRQRMQHDMMMRGLMPHTQQPCAALCLGRPPDTATGEGLRNLQIRQHESVSAMPINSAVSALRFLYR